MQAAQEQEPIAAPVTWSCTHCAFFIAMKEQKRPDSKIGNCHANAPSFQPDSTIGRFPIVLSNMFCGQFEAKQN